MQGARLVDLAFASSGDAVQQRFNLLHRSLGPAVFSLAAGCSIPIRGGGSWELIARDLLGVYFVHQAPQQQPHHFRCAGEVRGSL